MLKEEFENYRKETLAGSQIFYLYFIKSLPRMIKEINQDEVDVDKITFYLQVMTNLLPTTQVRNYVEKIR